jgi:hypothetical protein
MVLELQAAGVTGGNAHMFALRHADVTAPRLIAPTWSTNSDVTTRRRATPNKSFEVVASVRLGIPDI